MRIESVQSTELFIGPAAAPRQVVRVTLSGVTRPVRVEVHGPTVTTPEPVMTTAEKTEIGVHIAAPAPEGSVHRVTVVADDGERRSTAEGRIEAAATGWTMWMVSHFHYDPVWWNTQAGFTEVWHQLPDLPWVGKLRPPFVRTAFELVQAHLDAARHDPDYKFVLAEVDYLKPFWDVFPGEREQLRRFLRDERVELVGGTYNEPNTNLTHPESTIRNAVYGIGYQRDVLGGDPRTAWMLDVFGHDPSFPGLMADAGLDSSSWARGPFHMVGAKRHTGDITRMQFPSEFEWVSPNGRGLLTSYMANHYVAGWDMERKETLEEAMAEAYKQFSELKKVAATPNVMLPVGHDHNLPSRWCTEVHREWANRYVWPRFKVGLPREFFAAVRASLSGAAPGATSAMLTPQTRDMNPVYTGKDVSYIDTKQAQRAAEVAVLDAERLATLAALLGEAYPSEALDKAWRLLAYSAHHDAITGTESDQVYLDLLGGWREAYELGARARDAAIVGIAAQADTTGPGRPVFAVNTLSWARDGITTVRVAYAQPGLSGVDLRNDEGSPVPAVAEGVLRHPDGSLAELTLTFLATGVPSLGFRVYHLVPASQMPGEWADQEGQSAVENDTFRIEADPARGGALSRILDRRTGRELLRPGGLGGELYLQEEYDRHPVWNEGPWHLLPKGPGIGTREQPTAVRVQASPIGRRIVATTRLAELVVTQEATLWDGVDRIDFRTHVDGSIGQDHLLRARFDLDVPGALPVSEVGFAAIGRSFGFPNSDAGEHLYTLDNPAHTWAGLSATARIALRHEDGNREAHAIGVAEVVADPAQEVVRALLDRLVACGVTATLTRPEGPRYGALDGDSNLPDVRIVLNADSDVAARVLGTVPPQYRAALERTRRVFVPAERTRCESWVPSADVRGPRDLPVLIVAASEVGRLIEDLADATIEVTVPSGLPGTAEPVDDYSIAIVNRGTPGFVAEADGSFYVSLMRSCSSWPSGVWIDGPTRTTPDGGSFALQHWTHTFEYSLVAGEGDWRRAGFVHAGQEVNHRVLARDVPVGAGPLPARSSLGVVEPPQVVLTALKPRGNPMASGLPGDVDPDAGVTVRLYESTGMPATARVRLHGGLRDAVVSTVLEATDAEPAQVEGDDVVLPIGPAQIVTLGARAELRTGSTRHAEPAQPVFTRYWLHNKGPAPAGYLPVAVHLHPSAVHLDGPDDEALVRVTVAAAATTAAGLVELDVPDGLTATPTGPLKYDLAAGEHAEFELRLRADEAPGIRFVAARIRDELGQTLEDVVAATVGDPPAGDPLEVTLTSGPVELAPGGQATLTVQLTNHAGSEIRGEAQLLSPFGTWDTGPGDLAAGPWTQGFAVPAGASRQLRYEVRAPGDARPGAQWWAAVKVSAFGRVFYTAAVPIVVTDPSR